MNTASRFRDVVQPIDPPSVHELLNCLAIENGVLVGLDLQYTRMLSLDCPDLLLATSGESDQHSLGVARMLDSLPPNCTAQLLIQVRSDGGKALENFSKAERSTDEMARFLTAARVAHLNKALYKRVKHFLAITTHPAKTDLLKMRQNFWDLRVPDHKKGLAENHAERIQQLSTICANVQSALSDAKVKSNLLSTEAIAFYLYERLNPSTARSLPLPKLRQNMTLRSYLALNGSDNSFDRETIDGHHSRSVNLMIRPGMIEAEAMARLAEDIPGEFDLSVSIHSVAQSQGEKAVRWTATTAGVLGGLSVFSRYHDAELQGADAHAMLQHVKATTQKVYLMSAHIVLRDVDPHELTTHTEQTLQAMHRLDDSEAIVDDNQHRQLFLASLPGHAHLNRRTHIVHTEAAARFLAMSASWDGCEKPQFLTPTDDHKLLGVDLFWPDIPVRHGLILGVSGEGKSVFANGLAASHFAAHDDNQLIAIDDGGSYRRLCEFTRGQYLEPKLDGNYAFNPLWSAEHALNEEGKLDADFITSITLLVQLMIQGKALTNNEKTIIEKALVFTYSKIRQRPPLLEDFREALENLPNGNLKVDAQDAEIARGMGKNLELWTNSSYGRLLNRQSRFEATSRFVVFDLHEMTQDDLKPVIFHVIRSVIQPKLADKRLRKLVLLDEVWKFLREKTAAQLIEEWYKAGRKYNAVIMVATQSPEDLFKSPAAEAVIHNATVRWILNIGGGYDKLAQLKLNEREIAAVKDLGKNVDRKRSRKIFLKMGDRSTVIHNMLSPFEYRMYTTDPEDVNREARVRQQHPEWSSLEVVMALAEGRA